LSSKKIRPSKFEVIQQLWAEQIKDDKSRIVWNEHIRQQIYREFDCLEGRTWRKKVFYLLLKLNWKEEWIAKAMKVSIKTVRRMKKIFCPSNFSI